LRVIKKKKKVASVASLESLDSGPKGLLRTCIESNKDEEVSSFFITRHIDI